MRRVLWGVLGVALLAFQAPPDGDWPAYGRDPGGQRFSPLAIINRHNVSRVRVAWTFHTGDAYQPRSGRATAFEATPIYVDGGLYLATSLGRVIALDPVSGKQRWAYEGRRRATSVTANSPVVASPRGGRAGNGGYLWPRSMRA